MSKHLNQYLVVFDCCVTDEPYIKKIYAKNALECWEIAYPISKQPGLSEGNFEIYQPVAPEDFEA